MPNVRMASLRMTTPRRRQEISGVICEAGAHCSRWFNVLRLPFGSLLGSWVEKMSDSRYKGESASSSDGGFNMETVLIVLLVLFLIGGGGWGYSRWRG
jgi:hypothetical protein